MGVLMSCPVLCYSRSTTDAILLLTETGRGLSGDKLRQRLHKPRPEFTDTVLRFILRCAIRSSFEDKSYDVVRLFYDILGSLARLS